jgi:hypothetical protein
LKPVDDLRLLEGLDRQLAEIRLQDLYPAPQGIDAPQSCGPDLPLEIRVEKSGDTLQVGLGPLESRLVAGIAAAFDLAYEESLPVAHLLHGFNRALFARLHARNRELIHRHAIAIASILDVEPQMFKATSGLPTGASAPSSDGHAPSFFPPSIVRVVY